jgi:hypothetical protein
MAYGCTATFPFRGLCMWHLWSVSPFSPVARFSQWLLSNCSRCSLLKAAHPERFPHGMPVSPGVLPSTFFSTSWHTTGCRQYRSFFWFVWANYLEEWLVLLCLRLLLCVQSLLLFWRGANPPPPQYPNTHFSNPDGRSGYSVCDLQP